MHMATNRVYSIPIIFGQSDRPFSAPGSRTIVVQKCDPTCRRKMRCFTHPQKGKKFQWVQSIQFFTSLRQPHLQRPNMYEDYEVCKRCLIPLWIPWRCGLLQQWRRLIIPILKRFNHDSCYFDFHRWSGSSHMWLSSACRRGNPNYLTGVKTRWLINTKQGMHIVFPVDKIFLHSPPFGNQTWLAGNPRIFQKVMELMTLEGNY